MPPPHEYEQEEWRWDENILPKIFSHFDESVHSRSEILDKLHNEMQLLESLGYWKLPSRQQPTNSIDKEKQIMVSQLSSPCWLKEPQFPSELNSPTLEPAWYPAAPGAIPFNAEWRNRSWISSFGNGPTSCPFSSLRWTDKAEMYGLC